MKGIDKFISIDFRNLFEKNLRNGHASLKSRFTDNFERDLGVKLNTFKRYFQSEKPSHTPEQLYSRFYSLFFTKYGTANLAKNYYCLSELYQMGLLPSGGRILDLGCGPGAFELAYLLWLRDHDEIRGHNTEITMVDAVKEFLDIFKLDILKVVRRKFKLNSRHSIRIVQQNRLFSGELHHLVESPDVIVFSSSLSEMLRDPRVNVKTLLNSLINSNAIILIIDYGYDTIRPALSGFLSNLAGKYYKVRCFAGDPWGEYFDEINLGHVKNRGDRFMPAGANIKFIKSILIPKIGKIRLNLRDSADIVYKYKEAWERHDLKLLRSLFSKTAVYRERRNRTPFYGLEDICNYWKKNSGLQRDVSFDPLYIDTRKGKIIAHWRCKFYRRDLGCWMGLKGIFEALVNDGKIVSFEEQFQKVIGKEPKW